MSDNDGKKTLGLGGSRPSNVKQSFSHGRTKNVVVETKRKRVVVPKPGVPKTTAAGNTAPQIGGDPSKRPAGISDAELERRMKALAMAKAREAEETAKREAEEKARAAEREAPLRQFQVRRLLPAPQRPRASRIVIAQSRTASPSPVAMTTTAAALASCR